MATLLAVGVCLLCAFALGAVGQEVEQIEEVEQVEPVVRSSSLPLRIVGGANALIGRVEVQHNGSWGTICDDNFDLNDGHVICRQLGFRRAISVFHNGRYRTTDRAVPIWMDELRCRGDERALADCEFTIGRHDCDRYHREDAGVRCFFPVKKRVPIGRLPLRLRGGDNYLEGYLQVFYRNRWGLVGGDNWSQINSKVVCGEMGYCGAEETRDVDETSGHFNFSMAVRGDRPFFWMKDVSCHGSEPQLKECRHLGFEPYYGLPAAKVRCLRTCKTYFANGTERPVTVRLRGGAVPNEGRLEVFHSGRWGTVCGNFFYRGAASVACRQMGFGTVSDIMQRAPMGRGFGNIWMSEVQCLGNEASLFECKVRFNSRPNDQYHTFCSHTFDATFRCRVPLRNQKVRVHGGLTASDGYVHMRRSAQWAAVCRPMNPIDGRWSMAEATVACRDMGLGFAATDTMYLPPAPPANTTTNLVTHWMVKLRCRGDEKTLHECVQRGKRSWIGARHCPGGEATIRCTRALPDLVPDARKMMGSMYVDRQSLYRLRCAMEENCLSSDVVPRLARRELNYYTTRRLLRFSAHIMNRGTADFAPPKRRELWQWHSCHRHYHSVEEFSHFNITDLGGNLVLEGHKASFCLEDVECDQDTSRRYHCAHQVQGIRVNCADVYRYDVDCQWVDVTDLSSGVYILKMDVNPLRNIPESDFRNNIAWARFSYDRVNARVTTIEWGQSSYEAPGIASTVEN